MRGIKLNLLLLCIFSILFYYICIYRFCFMHQQTLRWSCNAVTDIHLPGPSVSAFLGSLSRSRCYLPMPLSRIVFLYLSVCLTRSRPAVPCCQARRRHTPSIVLILSYVGVAIVCQVYGRALFHWLLRMYLMCVAAWTTARSAMEGQGGGRKGATWLASKEELPGTSFL